MKKIILTLSMVFSCVSFAELNLALDQQELFDQAPKTEFVIDQWYVTGGCKSVNSDGSLSPTAQNSLNLFLENRMGTAFLTIITNGELEFEGFVKYQNNIISTYDEVNLIAFSDYSLLFLNSQAATICYMQ